VKASALLGFRIREVAEYTYREIVRSNSAELGGFRLDGDLLMVAAAPEPPLS
jgi:hypothetical protein